MDLSVEISALQPIIDGAQNIVILLPETATRDAVASALALYLSLSQSQKQVTIGYPKQPIVGWSHLVGLNKLTTKLGNKNFVISLDYQEGAIEKVSYNIEGNKFNLVIEPRPGAPQFDEKKVSYSYSGMNADVIIAVETPTRQALGAFYTENKNLFEEKPVVVVDNHTQNAQFGKINVVRPTATIAEIVYQLLNDLHLPIDMDIASNLFDGLITGSRNFTHQAVTAETFEIAAELLKSGAQRRQTPPPLGSAEERPFTEGVFTSSESPQPPPDWFKPKIFKGGGQLM